MDALQIFDEWGTYEKVVAGDYMHHREFFEALMDEVDEMLVEPLTIIDIGCGDVRPVLGLLERFQVKHYVGIDQSKAALELARKSLSRLNISYDLQYGSMLDELSAMNGYFDLAIAAYSLHHLDRLDKQAALLECRRLLRPDNILAVIDVFMDECETRPTYFGRWKDNAVKTFTTLTSDELQELIDHVHRCDFPETVSAYHEIGCAAGFSSVTSIREDRERLNKLVVLN